MSRFGTEGRGLLEDKYRELYWQLNEMQLIGIEWNDPLYRAVESAMDKIFAQLGYTPET